MIFLPSNRLMTSNTGRAHSANPNVVGDCPESLALWLVHLHQQWIGTSWIASV